MSFNLPHKIRTVNRLKLEDALFGLVNTCNHQLWVNMYQDGVIGQQFAEKSWYTTSKQFIANKLRWKLFLKGGLSITYLCQYTHVFHTF